MGNSYFAFKQFTIHQEQTAMKVCTDACLLGAICSNEISKAPHSIHRILDIGTGTGLLALMLAQESNAQIDAVESNRAAAQQALQNIQLSPWKANIRLIEKDIHALEPTEPYDFIISNPPFFESDLKSNDPAKNAAKHDSELTLSELVQQIYRLLKSAGTAAVLIPYHRTGYFETLLAEADLHIFKKISVQQSSQHTFFRSILFFKKEKTRIETSEINIMDNGRTYSATFTGLLQPFYLKL